MKINFPITLTAADSKKRTLTGRIVSWDEKGFTSAGATVFEKDSIDFSKPIKLLLEHDRTRPIGKMIDVTADDQGIEATFKVAATIAGDELIVVIPAITNKTEKCLVIILQQYVNVFQRVIEKSLMWILLSSWTTLIVFCLTICLSLMSLMLSLSSFGRFKDGMVQANVGHEVTDL